MADEQNNYLPAIRQPGILNKSDKGLIIRKSQDMGAGYVPHLGVDQVLRMAEAVRDNREGDRDRLLIITLFDACLRISEALSLRPRDIEDTPAGWQIRFHGVKKGGWTVAAISASLAAQLQAYAYRQQIPPDGLFYPINRSRAFQIIQAAMDKAGIVKPDGVGAVHILRHSGAIERLRRTNPKAVQDQLRHRSMTMTLRYLKTLAQEESLKIQQGVDYQW